jgi:erythromycin esterase-like protein
MPTRDTSKSWSSLALTCPGAQAILLRVAMFGQPLRKRSITWPASIPRMNRCSADVCRACGHAFGWCRTPPTNNCLRWKRDHLTAVIADLISLMEKQEAAYTRVSSSTEYRGSYRHAIGARQADTLLRKEPIGPPGSQSFTDAWELRDHAMSDNLRWIAEQTGSAKMLVFAHTIHLPGTTIRRQNTLGVDIQLEPFGTLLRRHYRRGLVAIGGLIFEGAAACKDYSTLHIAPPTTPTFEGTLMKLGVPTFALDLRTAPPGVAAWLAREQTLWGGEGVTTVLPLTQAFDAVFFSRTLTPACAQS